MKILIADDHPIFRKGLAEILATSIPGAVVWEAENGMVAEEIFFSVHPEIVILDINMPVLDGLKVCKNIKKISPGTKVVILSMYHSEPLFNFAFDLGADGYILKDNSAQDLFECLQVILSGEPYVSNSLKPFLIQRSGKANSRNAPVTGLNALTETERRVLYLVSSNLSSREIAERLFITEKSVENYRSRICKKLEIEKTNNSLLGWVIENKSILEFINWEKNG